MTKFFAALRDSFTTLLKQPKLFLPKIFIAALYSIQILFLASLTVKAFEVASIEVLNALLFLFVYLFGILILDILVNAMYPFLVKDFFEKKDVSLLKAFKKSLKKFFLVVPTLLLIEILFAVLIFVLMLPLVYFLLSNNVFGITLIALVTIAVIFLLAVFFFMIYPVATLEKVNIVSSIKRSFFLSKKNLVDVSKATAVSFFISVLSIILAFAIEFLSSQEFLFGSIVAILLFIAVRFITALLATYQYVLNPVFYFKYEKGENLS